MYQLCTFRRLFAAGTFAASVLIGVLVVGPAEARPHRQGYSSHSFQQFLYRRNQEYYGNYQRYGYRYALYVDAARYGHMYDRGYRRTSLPRYQARREREVVRESRIARRAEPVRARSRRIVDERPLRTERPSRAALLPQDGVSVQTPIAPPVVSRGDASIVVAEARRYIGGNPTGRRSLWCARFMNFVLARTGYHTTGSDMASSFARYGRRVPGPQVGAIAVMSRGRRGGHVGVVSGLDVKGNPIVVSGNHGHRVAEAVYSRRRIYAYVMPN